MQPDQAQAVNPLIAFPIIPYLLIFGIFYFLLIRPQQKQKKELQNMLKNLKKNDQVVTAAGIHGIVTLVKEKTVILRVDDSAKIEFDKEAIISVVKTEAA